jgi:hypothetical protein
MQLIKIFVSLLLTTAVAAKGNSSTKAVSDKSTCKEIAKMEKLVALAANTTKLESKTKNNATKIADIQSEASAASISLSTLTANETLMTTCAVIAAAEDTESDCSEMKDLQKLISLANTETALAAKSKGNETKAAKIQAEASTAVTKLATLTSNTTLVSECSAIASTKAEAKAEKAASQAAKGMLC